MGKQVDAVWQEILGEFLQPRKEPRKVDPFRHLEREYPFKHVRPVSISLSNRQGNCQVMGQAFNIHRYARDKRAHPEKPAFQNRANRIRVSRTQNAGWLEEDFAYNENRQTHGVR